METLSYKSLDIPGLLNKLRLPKTEQDALQAQRLFHGRGHVYQDLNHITIDWLPPVILITLFSPESMKIIDALSDALLSKLAITKTVLLQHRYITDGPIEVVRGTHSGQNTQQLQILEADLKYHIHLGKARNIGLFLDMKNGREWVKENSKGKRVINLFAYTCGFSVAAIAGGAKSVLNVDMSSPALSIGRDNHRLNQQSLEAVSFEKLNLFKSFGRIKKRGAFDLLICDPPTFQKGSVDVVRDYPKIMRRLNDFMAPESILMLCINAPHIRQENEEINSRDFLLQQMKINAAEFEVIDEIKPPKVFYDAQDKGMKTLIFRRKV